MATTEKPTTYCATTASIVGHSVTQHSKFPVLKGINWRGENKMWAEQKGLCFPHYPLTLLFFWLLLFRPPGNSLFSGICWSQKRIKIIWWPLSQFSLVENHWRWHPCDYDFRIASIEELTLYSFQGTYQRQAGICLKWAEEVLKGIWGATFCIYIESRVISRRWWNQIQWRSLRDI